MQLRKFEVSDAFEVSSVIRRAILNRDNRGYTLEQIYSISNYYCRENILINLNDKIIYVCVIDGKIVGTATLNKDEIMAVFILPEVQGKGLGKRFMEILEENALNKGLSKIWCVATLSAVDFYKKIGWHETGEKLHPEWGKGIFMGKILK